MKVETILFNFVRRWKKKSCTTKDTKCHEGTDCREPSWDFVFFVVMDFRLTHGQCPE
jgi:hypothetical protein